MKPKQRRGIAYAVLLGVAMASVVPRNVEGAGAPRGSKIQFAAPNSQVATNKLATKEDTLNPYRNRQPSADVVRPALDLPYLQPMLPQAESPRKPSNKTRELLDRRKNWAYVSREELKGGQEERDAEQRLAGEGANEPDPLNLTPEEKFYLSLFEQQDGNRSDDPNKSGLFGSKQDKPDPEEVRIKEALKERERELLEITGSEPGFGLATDGNLSGSKGFFATPGSEGEANRDFFGRNNDLLKEQTTSNKAVMNQFRELIGTPVAPSDPFKQLLTPITSGGLSVPLPQTTMGSSLTAPSGFTAPPPSSSIGFGSALPKLSEPGGSSMAPSLTPALPIVDSVRRYTPTAPTFTAPKRVF